MQEGTGSVDTYAIHDLGRGRLAVVLEGNGLAAVRTRIARAELLSVQRDDLQR